MADQVDIDAVKNLLRHFSQQRDWDKFHHPKNLAMSLAAEAGELLDIFRWLTETESKALSKNVSAKQQVAQELADVLLNAIRLADLMDINLAKAIDEKLVTNAEKYPVDRVKGSAKKYDQYS